jgi:hypothetical protein
MVNDYDIKWDSLMRFKVIKPGDVFTNAEEFKTLVKGRDTEGRISESFLDALTETKRYDEMKTELSLGEEISIIQEPEIPIDSYPLTERQEQQARAAEIIPELRPQTLSQIFGKRKFSRTEKEILEGYLQERMAGEELMSIEQLSKELGRSSSTVRSRLSRMRRGIIQ